MNKRLVAVLTALAMLVPALVILAPTGAAATTRVLAITSATATPTVAFQAFDGNPPKVFDINNDGRKEIIAQNDNQWVYIFDSKTGAILFEAKTTFPASWGARSFNGPEVAIMVNGGKPRLIVENSAAYVTAYEFDPSKSTSTKFTMTKLWERRLNDCHSNPGSDSKPTLADLDNDGDLEILLGTEELGVYALRMDGSLYWKNCLGGGNAEPQVGDLNRDGYLDVVHVSDGGVVAALNGRTGAWMWGYNVLNAFKLGSASMPVGPAIAQVDGVGGPDVVVGVRDSHDDTTYTNNHALLLALNSEGKLLWGKQDPTGNPLTYTHPMVVDADKDGKNEIYWGDWNTMGHKPPWDAEDAWQRLGPANFYRYDTAGNRVWKTSLDTYWSNKDLALADVDADGVQEVLANGPNGGHDGIWYLNGNTGAKEAFVDLYPWQASRGPIVADLWNTGKMQWVIEVGPSTSTAGHGILVYDTGVAYSSAWPHLPYVTKSRTTSPTPTLDATFTPKSLGNPDWVEVAVTASTTITKAYAKINDGPWYLLTKQTSGTWGRALSAPVGSAVQFRAFNAANEYDTSAVYTWTSSPTPTLDATFTPKSLGNPDWVEVEVKASTTITKAYAKINDGPWYLLIKQDSGTWGRALSAPSGSAVQFRAFNAANEYDTSAVYTWTVKPSPTLVATFSPQAVGNDNWVEVQVTSVDPITKAYAKINDGPWYLLTKQTSGSWGRALAAPNGSSVVFRAFNAENEYATSSVYTWT